MRRALLPSFLVLVGGLAAAQPAPAYYVWQDRELVEKISFGGQTDACDPGDTPDLSEDRHDQAIPGPARAVKIVFPIVTHPLSLQGNSPLPAGSITSAFVTATTPFDQVVHITARGAFPTCLGVKTKWKTRPVTLRVKYEQRVYTTVPPVIDCAERFVTIHKLQAQRASCAYAVSLARRYLVRARTLARRYITPYTCLDRLQGERRSVYCYAPGRRNVRFRYGS